MSDHLETIGNGTTFGTVKKEQNEYLYVVFFEHIILFQNRPFLIHPKTRKGQLYQWRRKTLFGIGSVKFLLSSFLTYRAVASFK